MFCDTKLLATFGPPPGSEPHQDPAKLRKVDVAVKLVVKNAMVSERVLGTQEFGRTVGPPQPGSEKWTS